MDGAFPWCDVPSNRDAGGARVDVLAGGGRQHRTVNTGYSYLSSHDPRLTFGLGGAEEIESLVIRWPSGAVDSYSTLQAGDLQVVKVGTGYDEPWAGSPPSPSR